MSTKPNELKPEQMPAFPLHNGDVWGGMTLRDYFAGQALAGILVDINVGLNRPGSIANDCYRLADAMLAARSE